MNNSKFMNMFVPSTNIYLWIIGVLVIILAKYNTPISVVGGIILIYLIFYNLKQTYKRKEKWKEIVENLSFDIDTATQKILLELPFPLVILRKDQRIIWYNSSFVEICNEEKNILDLKITDIYENINITKIDEITGTNEFYKYNYNNKIYHIFSNYVESINNQDMIMLYWLDFTEYEEIKTNCVQEKPVVAYIQIDNQDEILESISNNNEVLLNAIIDKKLNEWANEINAFIKKYENDKYIMIFENKYLSQLEEKRFNILDIIRETQSKNKIPITISIGVGVSKERLSFLESQSSSKSALDIALARGGDQAVIKHDEKILYYGGKTQAKEKRTKVKARVKAYGLKELIENSEKVFIMGHTMPDMDSLGAALGIYRCSEFLNKEAYIVLNKINSSITNLYEKLLDEGYKDIFISSDIAKRNITSNTLLVVVDTHSKNFIEDNSILDKIDKIIIIDHHRRGSDYIEESTLAYIEPYASSTCELVTELIEYIDEKLELSQVESNALLAGIYIDTKNFTFKTGVRTFEAASYLRRKGADTIEAKLLMKDDMETYLAKAEAIKNSQRMNDNIAIAIIENNSENTNLIVAQTADELLNIKDIDASFALAKIDDSVIISGRSFGCINVQVILEKLGGGGHLTVAGAQISNTTFPQALELLKKNIKQYLKDGDEI